MFIVFVSLLFSPTTLSSSVSACRLNICKGQVNFLAQEHFPRAAEYAIYTVDVPCALGSAYLQFSVNSAFSHDVCRTTTFMERSNLYAQDSNGIGPAEDCSIGLQHIHTSLPSCVWMYTGRLILTRSTATNQTAATAHQKGCWKCSSEF